MLVICPICHVIRLESIIDYRFLRSQSTNLRNTFSVGAPGRQEVANLPFAFPSKSWCQEVRIVLRCHVFRIGRHLSRRRNIRPERDNFSNGKSRAAIWTRYISRPFVTIVKIAREMWHDATVIFQEKQHRDRALSVISGRNGSLFPRAGQPDQVLQGARLQSSRTFQGKYFLSIKKKKYNLSGKRDFDILHLLI